MAFSVGIYYIYIINLNLSSISIKHFKCSIQTIKGDILNFFLWSFVLLLSEKAMAPHSSTLAWRIPGTGDSGGLPSMGSHRVGHD